jgi:hypothetical protein
METNDPNCVTSPGCLPAAADPVIGLLSKPTPRKNPVVDWPEQRIGLDTPVSYLQLNEKPMAWYWNLLLLLGGLGLAILPEARRFAKRKTENDVTTG